MSLALNQEQRLLKENADRFFATEAPVQALRELRDSNDSVGFSPELWQRMVQLGYSGTFIPVQYGGLGLGFKELGVVIEAAGHSLVASPLFSSIALCSSAVLLGGSESQKEALVPALAAGELLMAFALEEGPHHRPSRIACRAQRDGDSYIVSGAKVNVVDGHTADQFVVAARTDGEENGELGISLFLVDRHAKGVSLERRIMVDSRNMADVRFDTVHVEGSALLGKLHQGFGLLKSVIDRGNIALCAEMMGSALEVFERTLAFLQEREQFGILIGTFQALQHRAAQMFCELELSRSLLMQALQAIDEDSDDLSLLASQLKVQMAETLRLVADEAIQMHGGIGVTDEVEVGFFLKRARVAQQTLGDEHYHLSRVAHLLGY